VAKAVLVAVTGFGSIWRHKFRTQARRGHRSMPVYYNTTGVLVKGHLRQRPQICGYARFHAVGGFDSNHLSQMINRVFDCAEPSMWMGCNKVLFKRILSANEKPDWYLVLARSALHGNLLIGMEGWRSSDSWLLSFSEGAGQQEAMLLIPPGGWIRTDLGRFVLKTQEPAVRGAPLVLVNENSVDSHHALS
jgi:hypothetical protein